MLGAGAQVQRRVVSSKQACGTYFKISYLCGLNRLPIVLWYFITVGG